MDTEIKFRVDTRDKGRFEAAAEQDGRKLSDWVRRACFAYLGGHGSASTTISEDKPAMKALGKAASAQMNELRYDQPKDVIPVVETKPRNNPDKIAEAQAWLSKKK